MVKLIKDDGGMAFPRLGSFEDPQTVYGEHGDVWFEPGVAQSERGLSIRDYFAAKVLNGLFSTEKSLENIDTVKEMAEWAYKYADAMLEARK